MARMLVLLLGLAVIATGAYFSLQGGLRPGAEPPKRQLDNARRTADRLETELQQKADDIARRTQ